MKKIITTLFITLLITGCNLSKETDISRYRLKADDPNAKQPTYQYEQFENIAIQQAATQAVTDLSKRAPWLFKDYNSFVIGSAFNSDGYTETGKIGRTIGESLTQAFGKKKRARRIHYTTQMLRISPDMNGYLGLSQEATDFAQRIGGDALIVASYDLGRNDIIVHMNIIRAIDGYPILQYSYAIPMDEEIKTISRTK